MRGDGPAPVGEWSSDDHWTKTTYLPKIPHDHYADEDGLSVELQVDKCGADDGSRQTPPPAAKALSVTELQICNRIFAGVHLLNQFLAREISKAKDAARKCDLSTGPVAQTQAQMDREVAEVLAEHKVELYRLKEKELRADLELRRFAWDNKLTHREAHYEEVPAWTLAIIMAMVAGESLLNGLLFQQVVQGGLLQGVGLALMISLANVVFLGLLTGLWGWRNLFHVKPHNKVIGVVVTLVGHGVALFFNLFIAHLREAAELLAGSTSFVFQPGALMNAAWAHLTADPFTIRSAEGLILLIVGIGLHFIAAYEGFAKLADRYPRYREVDLAKRKALDDHAEYAESVAKFARAAIEDVEARFSQVRERLRADLRRIEKLVDTAEERTSEVRDSEDHWVLTGEALLLRYRKANLYNRGALAAPAYFDTYPTAEDYRRRQFGAGSSPSGAVEKEQSKAESSLKELRSIQDKAATAAEKADENLASVGQTALSAIQRMRATLAGEIAQNEIEGRKHLTPSVSPPAGASHA